MARQQAPARANLVLAVLFAGAFVMGWAEMLVVGMPDRMATSIPHGAVTLAGAGAPLASSLPASAVNAGIAVGSFAGGLAIDARGVPAAVLNGAAVAVMAVVAAWATGHIARRPSRLRPSSPCTAGPSRREEPS
jgi:DHA1 family inner membrane transport protein